MALTRITQPFGAVMRMWQRYRGDVRGWGAKGDGKSDDTVPLDKANEHAKQTGRNMVIPAGHYIYNGSGLSTNHYVKIKGEGSNTIIDASNNRNSGFVVTMNGNRTRLDNLELRGNPKNPDLKGVKYTTNQEDSGSSGLVFQDFHYGLELNKLWYCGFSDISFRNSPDVTLNGSHITFGGSDTESEVNNILFERVYLLGSQNKGVSFNCYTQNITWLGCSFENKGTRLQFNTPRKPNTTTLIGCYIEGTSKSNAIIAHSKYEKVDVKLKNCLIRLSGGNSSVMFDNTHGYLEGCHGGSPTVLLASATGSVTYVDDNTISTRDNFYVLQGGSWNNSTEETNFERYTATPKRLGAAEYNSVIPPFVHQKTIARGSSKQPVFAVYLPADGSNQRKMSLTLKVTAQSTSTTTTIGQEVNSLLICKGGGIGDGATSGINVLQIAKNGALVQEGSVEVTQLGYNSVTDSTKYLITYSPQTASHEADCFFELSGTFHNITPSERSYPWRVEKI